MNRNVYISVLGTTNYKETIYYIDNFECKTRFIQEASIKIFCNEWSENDKIFILVTTGNKGSLKKNWLDNGFSENGNFTGLKKVLENLNLKTKIECIEIKDGNTQEEIWENFDIIYELLNNDDEIYFDITHSFRSLPMLFMTLIHFSKLLKNVTVNSITYGNYEAKDDNNKSPIIDVTAFSKLQDWITASTEFIKSGQLNIASELCKNETKILRKESKNNNDELNKFSRIIKNINQIPEAIYACRGKLIYDDIQYDNFKEQILELNYNKIPPMSHILKAFKNKIENFGNNRNILNGFSAVKWCIDHNWLQQGFTILQETLLSYILYQLKTDWAKKENREVLSSCFFIVKKNIPEEKWIEKVKNNLSLAKFFMDSEILKFFIEDYVCLTGLRNDMNHSGILDNSSKINIFKSKLSNLFESISKKITPNAS